MSSIYVRDTIKTFLNTNMPTEKYVDLTGEFRELDDLLAAYSIGRRDPWIGLEFIGNDEQPITVAADGGKGTYRELGAVLIHVVDIAKINVSGAILLRCEAIRNILRGKRIGDIVIETVSPPSFNEGATLSFEGGYTAAVIQVAYEYDNRIS